MRNNSKCNKLFPGTVGYSGFNRTLWTPRTNSGHRSSVNNIRQCLNKTRRNRAESECGCKCKCGCRYSVLLELEYFDPVRMVVIDPMHNLFLGSAKHIMKDLWLDGTSDILTKSRNAKTCGRLPCSTWLWKNSWKARIQFLWIHCQSVQKLGCTVFYPCNVRPSWYNSLRMLASLCTGFHYVLACRILCRFALTTRDIQLADALLLCFCTKVEQLFGPSSITPNILLTCTYS